MPWLPTSPPDALLNSLATERERRRARAAQTGQRRRRGRGGWLARRGKRYALEKSPDVVELDLLEVDLVLVVKVLGGELDGRHVDESVLGLFVLLEGFVEPSRLLLLDDGLLVLSGKGRVVGRLLLARGVGSLLDVVDVLGGEGSGRGRHGSPRRGGGWRGGWRGRED